MSRGRGATKLVIRCVLAFGLASTSVQAANWPQKQVRIFVPYAAGSVPDIIARLIFDRVQKNTGQTMVIINKAGAAGMIGADTVAKSESDGHTLLLAPSGPLATNALLYKKMLYEPIRDLAPVALVAETPSILVVSNAVPARNVQELLRAMADPNSHMTYGSPGYGTLSHMSMAYLVAQSGGNVPHAPYAGSPQLLTALIVNDMQIAVLPALAVAPFVDAGKIKAIATIGPQRSTLLPTVSTLNEQGLPFDPVGWFGVAASGGTAKDILEQIHAAISLALKDPDVAKSYQAQGLDIADKGPQEFVAYIQRELARWKPVIEQNRITID
jgi:tripartite-type tricarboxylate transporter receptor subunit TctC